MASILISIIIIASAGLAAAQQNASTPAQGAPAVDEWTDNFDGTELDAARWERFSFEGGGGGKLSVEEGQLRMRGISGSRSGVRSKSQFSADRFIVEGTVAKVGAQLPQPGDSGLSIGTAVLTIMFDGSGRNRVEWILTSEGTFEAWSVLDGRGERLDNRKLATKIANPTLGIVRKGDVFMFMLNGQMGLEKTLKKRPRDFHVMLYGFGSSENDWDSVRVVTAK